jgi:beta-lactamase class A
MTKTKLVAIILIAQLFTISIFAQVSTIRKKIEQFVQSKNATIGVAIGGPEDRDTLTVNGAGHYPMQSVYKFHLAMAILDQVDKGKFSMDQKILVKKADLLPDTWSPIRDAYPEGDIVFLLKELLSFMVSKSDNNACDILFRLYGGPKELNKYVHAIGIKDINIAATEDEMHKSWEVQYTNWSTPFAAIQLLKKFHEKGILSQKSHDFLWGLMANSINGDRIRGFLPEETVVAHKTGSSGINAQTKITAAANDIGIVNLPDGRHFSIAVFVSDSKNNDSVNSRIIASITKMAWEYYAEKTLMAARQKFDYNNAIDSLINATNKAKKPFNGTILISQNGRRVYSKMFGFSDIDKKTALVPNDQYLTSSISNQVTAVLVLQEVEKGHIMLNMPIHKYLPDLNAKWADSVSVHQVLTHTAGIKALEKPLAFAPGTDCEYSQLGYEILVKLLETTAKTTFANLTAALFEKANMRNTFYPDNHKYKNLVRDYIEQADGKLDVTLKNQDNYNPAGGYVTTANDLLAWNMILHSGKLFTDSNSYKRMVTGYAAAQHPVLGNIEYGYGIDISNTDDILQLGQAGFYPGFVTLNVYFPATKTSVIILSNVARNPDVLQMAFFTHMQILNIIKDFSNLVAKTYKQ